MQENRRAHWIGGKKNDVSHRENQRKYERRRFKNRPELKYKKKQKKEEPSGIGGVLKIRGIRKS